MARAGDQIVDREHTTPEIAGEVATVRTERRVDRDPRLEWSNRARSRPRSTSQRTTSVRIAGDGQEPAVGRWRGEHRFEIEGAGPAQFRSRGTSCTTNRRAPSSRATNLPSPARSARSTCAMGLVHCQSGMDRVRSPCPISPAAAARPRPARSPRGTGRSGRTSPRRPPCRGLLEPCGQPPPRAGPRGTPRSASAGRRARSEARRRPSGEKARRRSGDGGRSRRRRVRARLGVAQPDRAVLIAGGQGPAVGRERELRDPFAPPVGEDDDVPASLRHQIVPGETRGDRAARRRFPPSAWIARRMSWARSTWPASIAAWPAGAGTP